LQVAASEWSDTVSLARQVMSTLARELIIDKRIFAGKNSKGAAFNDHAPIARFCANRAVALARPRGQIDIRFTAEQAETLLVFSGLPTSTQIGADQLCFVSSVMSKSG
jgi:hypothetical protein